MNKELEETIKSLKNFAYTMYGTFSAKDAKIILNYIKNSIPKEVIEKKIKERIKSVEVCYQNLIKPYYDEEADIIITSFMRKKRKRRIYK